LANSGTLKASVYQLRIHAPRIAASAAGGHVILSSNGIFRTLPLATEAAMAEPWE